MSENAIVVSNSFMEPVASVDQALVRYDKMKEFVSKILVENVDYGAIPGTGSKDVLLKPGAEKLSTFFGLHPIFEIIEKVEDWTGAEHGGEPFFNYVYRCNLLRNGETVGSGDGSCNSWEKKYRYRMDERVCPKCDGKFIIKGKEEYGGGWLCFRKKGGCGAKWNDGAQVIESQEIGMVKNPDPADQANTYLKMAQKRAMVAAVLVTVNASDYFTQDIDDYIPDGEYKDVTPDTKPDKKPDKKANGNGGELRDLKAIKAEMEKKAATYPDTYSFFDKGRNTLAAALDQFTSGRRKEVQVLLGLKESTKETSPALLQELYNWLRPSYDRDSKLFVISEQAEKELGLIVAQLE